MIIIVSLLCFGSVWDVSVAGRFEDIVDDNLNSFDKKGLLYGNSQEHFFGIRTIAPVLHILYFSFQK
jgi:hypothetical protein